MIEIDMTDSNLIRRDYHTARSYAIQLLKKYNLQNDLSVIDGTETTDYEVARKVLPKEQLIDWLRKSMKEVYELRKKFNSKPYNKFNKEIETIIKNLEK